MAVDDTAMRAMVGVFHDHWGWAEDAGLDDDETFPEVLSAADAGSGPRGGGYWKDDTDWQKGNWNRSSSASGRAGRKSPNSKSASPKSGAKATRILSSPASSKTSAKSPGSAKASKTSALSAKTSAPSAASPPKGPSSSPDASSSFKDMKSPANSPEAKAARAAEKASKDDRKRELERRLQKGTEKIRMMNTMKRMAGDKDLGEEDVGDLGEAPVRKRMH